MGGGSNDTSLNWQYEMGHHMGCGNGRLGTQVCGGAAFDIAPDGITGAVLRLQNGVKKTPRTQTLQLRTPRPSAAGHVQLSGDPNQLQASIALRVRAPDWPGYRTAVEATPSDGGGRWRNARSLPDDPAC